MIDVKDVLDYYGIDYKSHGKNVGASDVNVDCPWCGAEKHLGIHVSKTILNCWVCSLDSFDRHPSFINMIAEITGINECEISNTIEDNFTDGEIDNVKQHNKPAKTVLPNNMQWFDSTRYRGDRDIAYSYLKSRNISKKHIQFYNLAFTPIEKDELYSGRIIVPIYLNGILGSWLGRDYTRTQHRYKNCGGRDSVFRIKELLYGLDTFSGTHLRLVEGIFDRIALGNTSVAVFKAKISREQRAKLIKLNLKSLSIIFDYGQGIGNAIGIAEDLSPFIEHIKVVEVGKKDVADLGANKVLLIEKDTPHFVS